MTHSDEFSVTDVGISILDAVAVLHSQGHQLIRILPGMSASGTHWRVRISSADDTLDGGDGLHVVEVPAFVYSTGMEFDLVGVQVSKATRAEDVAAVVLASIPGGGIGSDPTYVEWYQRLLGLVHRHHALPVAYADYFDSKEWEIGWGSRVTVPPPPKAAGKHGFSAHVAEQVGWYVYALRNPLDGRVFYVGKGKGNRVFSHAEHAQASNDEDVSSQKLDLIKSIHAAGKRVDAFTIRHGIATEELAYDIEASVIDMLRLLDSTMDNESFVLTNIVLGHGSSTHGLASIDVVASLYEAPRAPDINAPTLLIKIPGLWTPTMSETQLYEATRQWWKLGVRRNKAHYAFAVNHGVIRSVYRIESWEPSWYVNDERTTEVQTGPPDRWRFVGRVDAELFSRYRNTSVKHLYKPGAANPVRYLNC